MEFYLDKEKSLKFQLSSPDLGEEGKEALVGEFVLDFKDFNLCFPVDINENWVATVTVPKLNKLLKTPKEGDIKGRLCLHDQEYFFPVWEEDVEILKGRPDIKAKPLEEKSKKKKKTKAVVEAKILEEEVEEPINEEVTIEGDDTPDFQKAEAPSKGLKSYLDHLGN